MPARVYPDRDVYNPAEAVQIPGSGLNSADQVNCDAMASMTGVRRIQGRISRSVATIASRWTAIS